MGDKLVWAVPAPMRLPAVAGTFYPARPASLDEALDEAFARGPGGLPATPARRAGRVRALVVPHAGYAYSGHVAAHAYAALAADGLPESALLVGPHHAGGTLLSASAQAWSTPLGDLSVDDALLRALRDAGPIVVDERAHAREHSIEVQLPFLQRLARAAGRQPPRFVAVTMGIQDETTAAELAHAIVTAARGRDLVLVASTDLAHVGPDYSIDAPPGTTVDAHCRALDERFLRAVDALDDAALLDAVARYDLPSCGHGPVAAVLRAARALGATRARRLAHATSHDVRPHASCVGYCAYAIEA